jgi:hypothetical protein
MDRYLRFPILLHGVCLDTKPYVSIPELSKVGVVTLWCRLKSRVAAKFFGHKCSFLSYFILFCFSLLYFISSYFISLYFLYSLYFISFQVVQQRLLSFLYTFLCNRTVDS